MDKVDKMSSLEFQNIMNDINMYKIMLRDSDYKATKHSEGLFSEEEYAPIKAQREEWRAKINELEAKLVDYE